MKPPTYPDADHSAAARPTISMTPAAPREEVTCVIGPLNVSTADAGPSWPITVVRKRVIVALSNTSPAIETSAISAGNSDRIP